MNDLSGTKQRSNAWYAVTDVLDKHVENWLNNGGTASIAAVNTIEKLATSKNKNVVEQDSELITDYAAVLTKEEVQQLINEVAAVSPSAGLHLAKFFLNKTL